MNKWNVNSATIVGRDHELTKKNRQDFVSVCSLDNRIIGVACDGCGESQYSEVGACLLGTYITNYFKEMVFSSFNGQDIDLHIFNETNLKDVIDKICRTLLVNLNTQNEQVSFIKDFMLSTNLFCFIFDDYVHIGYCGDGVIIIDDNIEVIDQKGSPHYIAYKNVPKEALEKQPTELSYFNFKTLKQKDVNKIVIATDGLLPIIDKSLVSQLYGTQKRQLQRKFNIWQEQKMFGDDASCIVFEKQHE
jgi:serine/threonine protein phosphatase PrpC